VTRFLDRQSKLFWGIIGIALVLIFGIVDYWTGFEVSFSFFYLIPISLAGWYAGRRLGLITAGVSAIAWFLADLFSGNYYSDVWIYLWNTLIRLGFFVVIAALIAELRRAYKANQELARIDYITGAVSIRYFYELGKIEIGRANRYKRPFTLAYVDLDNFKDVNDRLGHSTGDKVLRAVTLCVQRQIRNMDVFARLGGDEFGLLMPETGEVEAQAVVSRLRTNLLEEMRKNGWQVTFSIGVVTFVSTPKSVDDMVKMADDVMYPVKAGGKDGVSYTIYEG